MVWFGKTGRGPSWSRHVDPEMSPRKPYTAANIRPPTPAWPHTHTHTHLGQYLQLLIHPNADTDPGLAQRFVH